MNDPSEHSLEPFEECDIMFLTDITLKEVLNKIKSHFLMYLLDQNVLTKEYKYI